MKKYNVIDAEVDINVDFMYASMHADDYNELLPLIWELLNNHSIVPVVRDTLGGMSVTPFKHSWVIAFIDDIVSRTRLTPSELVRLLDDTHVPTNEKMTCTNALALILVRARNVPFEPLWHQNMRGDTKPLPKEAWLCIRDVYMDRIPTKHMRTEDEDIRKARKISTQYARMLDKAYKESSLRQDESQAEYDSMGNRITKTSAMERRFA